MRKNIFFAILAQTGLSLVAALFINASLTSCSKEKHKQNSNNGEIILKTSKEAEDEINLWFAQDDSPIVEGAAEVSSNPSGNGWIIKKYRLASQTVTIKGKVTKLRCSGCGLTEIQAEGHKKLTTLYCQENQIESLNLSGCTQLNEVYCYKNNIDYKNLTLAKINKGLLYFSDLDDKGGQQLTPDEVKRLKEKGWTVKQKNGSDWEPYNGKDYIITFTTMKEVGNNIELHFDPQDSFVVEGATETESIQDARGWVTKKYNLASKTVTIKGRVTRFECYSSKLKTLDITENAKIKRLNCDSNELETLDISNNKNLTILECRGNLLKTLNTKENTKLEVLHCSENQLEALDVSNSKDLIVLNCGNNNNLETLDISKNKDLIELYCDNNKLKALNTKENSKLDGLVCSQNQLEALDISNNKDLKELYCDNNKLEALNISNNKDLKNLYCYNNKIKELDASNNHNLAQISCFFNNISYDKITLPTKTGGRLFFTDRFEGDTQYLTPKKAKELADKGWEVKQSVAQDKWDKYHGDKAIITLTTLVDVGKKITFGFNREDRPIVEGAIFEYDSERNSQFVKVYRITDKNITIRGKVGFFDCRGEKIQKLNVSENEELTSLICYNNSINELDLSKNKKLKYLNCSNNALLKLDLSKNTLLEHIQCQYNRYLNELNAINCTALTYIRCDVTFLTYSKTKLPTVSGGRLYFRQKHSRDQKLTKDEATQIRNKGWNIYQITDFGTWESYFGEK